MKLRSAAILLSAVSPLVLLAAAPLACSDAPISEPTAATTSDAVVVSASAGCQVAWTKINYENPGADNNEFIELRVRNSGSISTTLGACGLKRIELLNGSLACAVYRSFDVASVVVPADGYVVICNKNTNSRCDINTSAIGWLQNADSTDTDEISFINTSDKTTVHGSWGGTGNAACVPAAGAGDVVRVQSEFQSENPDQVNLDCGTGFRKVDIANAQPATDSCSRPDGGTGTGGSGGASSGGASSGGASSGGASSGGASSGGASSGGSGGAASGGASTGGAATGGAATGGASTGGAATGGAASGGAATGGASTGGAATGGAASGGAATGGASSGGAATGGAATGGASVGGSGNGGSGNGGSGNGGSGNGGSGNGGSGNGGSTAGGSAGAAGATTGGTGGGSEDDGGCGCRTMPEPTSPRSLVLLLTPLALLLRRRRRGADNS